MVDCTADTVTIRVFSSGEEHFPVLQRGEVEELLDHEVLEMERDAGLRPWEDD